ncbi:MAG: hypothetical protein K2H50_08880 [Paramuribaculum sp.]|nr:hypothetical protein [Paramuribaculum sp.]
MMKITHFTIISLLLVFIFAGCAAEDDALTFVVDSVTNQENVQFDYYYADAEGETKIYWLCANSNESELTLSCNNSSAVQFENLAGEISDEYSSRNGYWTAKFITPYTVVFTFDKIDPDSVVASTTVVESFNFISKYEDPVRRTKVQVTRLTRSSEQFEWDNNVYPNGI